MYYCAAVVYSIILFKEACRFSLFSLLSWRWFCTFSHLSHQYTAYMAREICLFSLSLSLSLSFSLSLSLSLSLSFFSLFLSLSPLSLSLVSLYLSLYIFSLSLSLFSLFSSTCGSSAFPLAFYSSDRRLFLNWFKSHLFRVDLSRHDRKRQGSFHSFPHAESVYFGVRPWFIGIQSADIVLRWGHRTEQRASQHYFPVSACKWMFGSGLNGCTRTVSAARAMSSIQIYRYITYWAPQAPVHQQLFSEQMISTQKGYIIKLYETDCIVLMSQRLSMLYALYILPLNNQSLHRSLSYRGFLNNQFTSANAFNVNIYLKSH